MMFFDGYGKSIEAWKRLTKSLPKLLVND